MVAPRKYPDELRERATRLAVEIRNERGSRIDPFGNEVSKNDPGNHTPIDWDLP